MKIINYEKKEMIPLTDEKLLIALGLCLMSLSKLVDNLSEIYQKECKGCEERRKIKSVCNFIGLKNNKLNYECK